MRNGSDRTLLNAQYPFDLGRPRMSMRSRAAQFAPFAALTGYEQVVLAAVRQVQQEAERGQSGREAEDS